MFYVGQKVVCVDAADTAPFGEQELQRGAVYTVQWCGTYTRHRSPRYLNNTVCVHLLEVNREPEPDGEVVPFAAPRFRPITERKTSIEVFKRLLNPTERERADA